MPSVARPRLVYRVTVRHCLGVLDRGRRAEAGGVRCAGSVSSFGLLDCCFGLLAVAFHVDKFSLPAWMADGELDSAPVGSVLAGGVLGKIRISGANGRYPRCTGRPIRWDVSGR